MVRITITDYAGGLVCIMEYASKSRLDRKIMRSIEFTVGDATLPYFGYILPLNVNITTDVSSVNLFVGHAIYYNGVYCNILRKPFKNKINYVSSRRILNKGR